MNILALKNCLLEGKEDYMDASDSETELPWRSESRVR